MWLQLLQEPKAETNTYKLEVSSPLDSNLDPNLLNAVDELHNLYIYLNTCSAIYGWKETRETNLLKPYLIYFFFIKNMVRWKFISSLIVLNIIFWPGYSSKIEDMLNIITDQGST